MIVRGPLLWWRFVCLKQSYHNGASQSKANHRNHLKFSILSKKVGHDYAIISGGCKHADFFQLLGFFTYFIMLGARPRAHRYIKMGNFSSLIE